MEDTPGLPLVHLVRDWFRNEFNNFQLADLTPEDKFRLFSMYIMGIFLQEKINDDTSYISGLINEAIAQNALDGVIRLGYDQASTFG